MNDRLWYKNAVFYEVYPRAFFDSNADGHGDLRGLITKLDYIQELGVDCIWLLPIYPSPLEDDGYDISDYYGILAEFGSISDFQDLLDAAHQRGIRVIADLVLNHTSDQHFWFQEARKSRDSIYRDYYVWSDTDQKYTDARIIFIDTEKSNWTWDETAGQYYWHRFYASQPDLNFDNPKVQEEMLNVVRFWLDMGVDGFRVDAVPYLIEREGTICENLPETHDYLKKLRRFVDENYPGRVLLCEANQWPEDVRSYFGDGDEFHMGFHFPLMPRIFKAIREGDNASLHWILGKTPPIPDNCQWCIFLRNHDELTLEMVTEEERQWLWQEYAPEMRMRLNLGIRRRLAPLLDNDRRKIEVVNSLLFSLPGSPIIYYGDEIGMGENIWLPDRNGVRTPMQWDDNNNAGFSQAASDDLYSPVIEDPLFDPKTVNVALQKLDPNSLWHTIRRMITVHKENKAFGWGDFSWYEAAPKEIAAYWRNFQQQKLLILNNLSNKAQKFEVRLSKLERTEKIIIKDMLSAHVVYVIKADEEDKISVNLNAYQYKWLEITYQ
jgi:maltose alpha-D-glucosyltransferase / alpha-amylase